MEIMLLTKKDRSLIKKAKSLVGRTNVRGGYIKSVGCVLVTEKGKIFTGVNLELACGIGFCAEHSAVAAMATRSNETFIKTLVASDEKEVRPPCGRCRELLNLLDEKNLETDIIVSHNKKVKLKELLPLRWEVTDKKNCKVWE